MCELTNLIKGMVDKKDPSYKTQQLISLLAQATDSKFRHLEKNLVSGLTEHSLLLKDISKKVDKHQGDCPHKIPKKLEKLSLLFTLLEYPKVFWLALIGILSLMGLGIDRLIGLISAVL